MCVVRRTICAKNHTMSYTVLEQCERANIKWHNADRAFCMIPGVTRIFDSCWGLCHRHKHGEGEATIPDVNVGATEIYTDTDGDGHRDATEISSLDSSFLRDDEDGRSDPTEISSLDASFLRDEREKQKEADVPAPTQDEQLNQQTAPIAEDQDANIQVPAPVLLRGATPMPNSIQTRIAPLQKRCNQLSLPRNDQSSTISKRQIEYHSERKSENQSWYARLIPKFLRNRLPRTQTQTQTQTCTLQPIPKRRNSLISEDHVHLTDTGPRNSAINDGHVCLTDAGCGNSAARKDALNLTDAESRKSISENQVHLTNTERPNRFVGKNPLPLTYAKYLRSALSEDHSQLTYAERRNSAISEDHSHSTDDESRNSADSLDYRQLTIDQLINDVRTIKYRRWGWNGTGESPWERISMYGYTRTNGGSQGY